MENNVDNYIMLKNAIPKKLCDEIIRESETQEWRTHTWYSPTTKGYGSEETKELEVCNCMDKHDSKLKPYVIEVLKEYQKSFTAKTQDDSKLGYSWISKISNLRLNRYSKGTKMREHQDHIHSIFDGKAKGVPILSIIINLNEDYNGAEFYCRGKELKLKTGDVLIFPSNFMFPHEVKECLDGVRYSIVAWAY